MRTTDNVHNEVNAVLDLMSDRDKSIAKINWQLQHGLLTYNEAAMELGVPLATRRPPIKKAVRAAIRR
jgi:hypothetical protein